MRKPFDRTRELFAWGPVPGRYYFVSIFSKPIFEELPGILPSFTWPRSLFLFKDRRMIWISQQDDVVRNGIVCFKAYMLDDHTRKEHKEKWLAVVEKMRKTMERMHDLGRLSDEEFLALYEEFYGLYKEFWIHATVPELGNYGATVLLEEELAPYVGKEELHHAMEVLTAPIESSFYQQEELDLAAATDLKAHAKKYSWLQNSYAGEKRSDVAYFAGRKKLLAPHIAEEIARSLLDAKHRKAEFVKKHAIPKDVAHIGEVIAENIIWQDERKKNIWIVVHYQQMLVEECSRRLRIPLDKLLDLRHDELPRLLRGERLDIEGIHRARGYDSDRRDEHIGPEETEALWEEYAVPHVEGKVEELSGIVASRGKATGKASILLDPHAPFAQGDILITTMTSPEFIFAMKKAAAIVTDTGGLTSHAAIVSRELKVPCIVGTKSATQVFKDGDLLEVDADNSIVRRMYPEKEGRALVRSFLEETDGLELAPPQRNSCLLVQASGWNRRGHFTKWYHRPLHRFPVLYAMRGTEGIMYYSIGFAKTLAKEVFHEYWDEPAAFERRRQDQDDLMRRCDELYGLLTPEAIATMPFEEASGLLARLAEAVFDLNGAVLYAIYLDQAMVRSFLGAEADAHGACEALAALSETWERLVTPVEDSFERRQELHVLSLIAQGSSFDAIATACQYQRCSYAHLESWQDAKEAFQEGFGSRTGEEAREEVENARIERDRRIAAFEGWKGSQRPATARLADFLQHAMAIRDRRKDHMEMLMAGMRRVADRAFTEAGVPLSLIPCCGFEELLEGPRTIKEHEATIRRRQEEGAAVLVHYEGPTESAGEFHAVVEAVEKAIRESHQADGSVREIGGQGASQGKAKGRACVVADFLRDKGKFRDGDILVAGMTRPEYVPLMRKAAGIVTDEGGITCHAAIVSRERGIPCVVGTKVATHVLKDGDRIEVDADKGIVRKLS